MIPFKASVLWIKLTFPLGFFISLPTRLNIGFLSSPIRPPKRIIVEEIFYNFFSEKFNLPKPKFKNEEPLIRIIEGNKISKLTPFNYSVNNLLI